MEALHGYPIDGVVLTISCGKTMPVCPMTVATTHWLPVAKRITS